MSLCNMSSSLKRKRADVCDILSTSLQRHFDSIENESENASIFDMIEKSTAVMKRLGSEALENTEPNEIKHKDLASDYDEKDLSLRLRTLSDQSLTACRNLHLLVDQMNNRSKSKKTSGNAWRTLQSIVDRSLDMKNTNVQKFATLVLGITMSQMNSQLNTTNNSFGSVDTRTKMITSAIIPNSPFFDRNESGNCSKHERLIKFVARDSLLDLLRQSVDHNIDLQTVARIAFAFGVCSEQDHELGRAVANVVRYVFGNGCCCSDPNNDDDDDDELGSEDRIVNKDKASPTLALVAQCRPFSYIKTDELVRVAVADLDLWYSAELVCDASISSVTSNKKMETNLMVTSYPKFEPSELISIAQRLEERIRMLKLRFCNTLKFSRTQSTRYGHSRYF